MLTWRLVVLVVVGVMVGYVSAGCYFGRSVEIEKGKWGCNVGEGVKTLKPQESVVTDSCYNCICFHSGYRCCGIGLNAGAGMAEDELPHGYELKVNEDCSVEIVPADTQK